MRSAAAGLRRYPKLLPTDTQLRLVGLSPKHYVAHLCAAVTVGVMVPGLAVSTLQRVGIIGLSWFAPVLVAVLCGAVVALIIHVTTIEHAAAARTDLRYQLSAYLDVVTMLLAGNSGYEGALEQASHAGDGRLFAEVRRRMRECAARAPASPTRCTNGRRSRPRGARTGRRHRRAQRRRRRASRPHARRQVRNARTALATEQESEAPDGPAG